METSNFNFNISAPGKVILHGEHAVVYGKPAIAAAISLRNHLIFKVNSTDSICFLFNDLDLSLKFDTTTFNTLLTSLIKAHQESTSSWDHSTVLQILQEFLAQKLSIPTDEGRKFKTSLAVLYLMCGICISKHIDQLRKGIILEMNSDVKIGAGLGSSASFAVCVAAAFYIFARGEQIKDTVLNPTEKRFISDWAFNSEKIMHGNPSGVDNEICTFGGIVKFTKGLPLQQMQMQCNLSILLVDTKVGRSTAKLVEKVVKLKMNFPQLVDNIMTALGECTEQAALVYENADIGKNAIIEELTKLFEINNGLLQALRLSHCKLEEIFLIAKKHGLASKLTGAGGGGYAIILLPDNYKKTNDFQCLCKDLDKGDFGWSEAIIGDAGVSIDFFNK